MTALSGRGAFPYVSAWLRNERNIAKSHMLNYQTSTFDGQSEASMSPMTDFFFYETGAVKFWNGSQWLYEAPKSWNGSAWSVKTAKYWNGSAWANT